MCNHRPQLRACELSGSQLNRIESKSSLVKRVDVSVHFYLYKIICRQAENNLWLSKQSCIWIDWKWRKKTFANSHNAPNDKVCKYVMHFMWFVALTTVNNVDQRRFIGNNITKICNSHKSFRSTRCTEFCSNYSIFITTDKWTSLTTTAIKTPILIQRFKIYHNENECKTETEVPNFAFAPSFILRRLINFFLLASGSCA